MGVSNEKNKRERERDQYWNVHFARNPVTPVTKIVLFSRDWRTLPNSIANTNTIKQYQVIDQAIEM